MTKLEHLTPYSTLHLCGVAVQPWCWQLHCPAAPEPPALLSVCLFGSTTVAYSLGDMLQKGELTNVLEDQKNFKEEILWFLRRKKILKNEESVSFLRIP